MPTLPNFPSAPVDPSQNQPSADDVLRATQQDGIDRLLAAQKQHAAINRLIFGQQRMSDMQPWGAQADTVLGGPNYNIDAPGIGTPDDSGTSATNDPINIYPGMLAGRDRIQRLPQFFESWQYEQPVWGLWRT